MKDLTIIGERINPGFKSSKELLDRQDIAGIQALAVRQVEAGAAYLTVNVGPSALEDPAFMIEVIQAIQHVVAVPLAFDVPDATTQQACLGAYDINRAGGRKPIVNSLAETRWDMVEALVVRPCRVILMASERMEDGQRIANSSAHDVHATAGRMVARLLTLDLDIAPDDVLLDVAVPPFASDTEGLTQAAIDGARLITTDPDLAGVHVCGGLSNVSQQLPKAAPDQSDLRLRIENAFLTVAMESGLDTVLATPWRGYSLLPDDDFVLREFREIIDLRGVQAMRRVRDLYRENRWQPTAH